MKLDSFLLYFLGLHHVDVVCLATFSLFDLCKLSSFLDKILCLSLQFFFLIWFIFSYTFWSAFVSCCLLYNLKQRCFILHLNDFFFRNNRDISCRYIYLLFFSGFFVLGFYIYIYICIYIFYLNIYFVGLFGYPFFMRVPSITLHFTWSKSFLMRNLRLLSTKILTKGRHC